MAGEPGGVRLAPKNAVHEDGQWPRLEQVDSDAGEEETHGKADTPAVGSEVAEGSYQQPQTCDGTSSQVTRPHDDVHRSSTEIQDSRQMPCRPVPRNRSLKTRLFRGSRSGEPGGRCDHSVILTRATRRSCTLREPMWVTRALIRLVVRGGLAAHFLGAILSEVLDGRGGGK